jgi:hypothetical protein
MANGSSDSPRSTGLFSGLLLIAVGTLALLQRYGHLNFAHLARWALPLILIVWGLVKFYERTLSAKSGSSTGWITAGEIFLVVGLFCLGGILVIVDLVREKIDSRGGFEKITRQMGDDYSFDLEVHPQPVPANARVQINVPRGDINVHTSDEAQINVTGKKKIKSWNEGAAQKLEDSAKLEIAKDGDNYVVRPSGAAENDQRYGFDLEVTTPKKAPLDIKNERGDITVADVASNIGITSRKGDIELSDIGGSITVDTQSGDTRISDIKGDVKISGKGGEINVTNATGGLTVNGEFYGPIRAEKVLKGVRFISHRTDFTLTQLTGHMSIESGNFEIVDAPGNLALRTSADISIENPGGKVNVDNRNGNIDVRYSAAPKDDIQITNSSSQITLSLPGSASFEIVGDCHSCDIESEFSSASLNKTTAKNGDTHLEGKYGSGRSVKIILRTSYGAITIRKTS